MCVNLDIGHFTAAGYDAVDYLEKHHDRIVTLHFKDRKKNHGANLPFGEGETPIKEVLHVLKTKHYKIPANIEYEYKGADSQAEVAKCYQYMKQALGLTDLFYDTTKLCRHGCRRGIVRALVPQ